MSSQHSAARLPTWRRRTLTAITAAAMLAAFPGAQANAQSGDDVDLSRYVRTLDGSKNNLRHPDWGRTGTNYTRVGDANYADGKGAQALGPNPRLISNRIFNDSGQNLFSQRGVTQWGWTWGQFLDHTFGLAQGGGEKEPMPFSLTDPL